MLEWASLYRLSTIYSIFELFYNICFYTNSSVISTFSFNQVWLDHGQGISSDIELSSVRIRHIQPKSPECVCVLVAQSCPTLCDPMDCSQPGSPVNGILQARILEWISIPFSRGSSLSRDWTLVSCIAGRFFTNWATGKSLNLQRLVGKPVGLIK